MGRRKISIAPISDDRNRQVTFLKRKNGLFKKAYELGVLCSADVAVVVFNANGKLFEFHSGDMDTILLRYSHYAGPPHEKRGPQDYINKDLLAQASKSKMGGKMTNSGGADDEDEDDEGFEDDLPLPGEEGMDGEEEGAEGSSGVMTMAQHERIRQSSTVSNGAPPPVASGSGSSTGNGKKVVEGKGKQAVVAAKAREKRTGSIASDNGTIERPPSNESYSQSQPPPQPPNYPPPYPPASSNSTPSDYPPYSLPPPSNPQNHQHQHSQNPYSFLSGFPPPTNPNQYGQLPPPPPNSHYPAQFPQYPPHGLPPPPNPADLFSMGLFGNAPPPPGMIPNQNQNSQNGGGNPMNFFGGPQGGNFNFGAPQGGGYPNPFGANFTMPGMNGYPSSSENQGGSSQGGVPNWFGSSNPMLAAIAQQQQQQQQQQQAQYMHSQRQHSHASQQQRPASRASNASNSRQSPEQQRAPSSGPTRQDSSGSTSASKPRLVVAIPKESNAEEGRKKGLVTAGGASILGKGFEGRGSGDGEKREGEENGGSLEKEEEDEDEHSQPTAVPRSAFASDLIAASPFYPPSSQSQNPYNYPLSSSSGAPPSFGWPSSQPPSSSFRPAPMLGESDAPDLIRDSPDPIAENSGAGEEGEAAVRRLKRPSVDLEDGMEGLEVEGNSGPDGKQDEDGGDRRKRRA